MCTGDGIAAAFLRGRFDNKPINRLAQPPTYWAQKVGGFFHALFYTLVSRPRL